MTCFEVRAALLSALSRRPSIPLAVSFLTGCVLGLRYQGFAESLTASSFYCGAVFFLLVLIIRVLAGRLRIMALGLLAVLVAGILRGGVVTSRHEDRAGLDSNSQVSYYEAVIDTDPEAVLRQGEKCPVAFDAILDDGRKVSVSLWGAEVEEVAYGDTLRLKGYLSEGRGGRLYLSGWLVRGGVLSHGEGSGIKGRLFGLRRKAATLLEEGISDFPVQSGILKALVLGYRRGVSHETRDQFIATGTLHIFAISGLHVGIACGFVIFVLRSLRVPPMRWFPFLLVVLGGYTVMTGGSSSAWRACTMALVFYAAPALGRKADFVSALAFSAFLLVAIEPGYLLSAGFILSFAVAGGICFLGGAMIERSSVFWRRDPFLPEREGSRSELLRWFTGSAAVSVSAWLVSAPLMLFFFERLSLTGIVSNIVTVPLAFLTVLSGCCSIIFGQISTLMSDLFNHASLALILLLQGVLDRFAAIPFGAVNGVSFGLFQVLLWYLLLGLLTVVLRGFFAQSDATGETGR